MEIHKKIHKLCGMEQATPTIAVPYPGLINSKENIRDGNFMVLIKNCVVFISTLEN
jgi:hypothetical protein